MELLYDILKAIHILMAVLWLGTDIGTFASFRRMRDATLSVSTRLSMSHLSDLLDMGPRSALVILLMLGLYMTHLGEFGLSGPTGSLLAQVSALIGLLWLAGVWHQYWVTHPPAGQTRSPAHVRFQRAFRTFDIYWRVGVSLALALLAVASLAGAGPFRSAWLAWKLILFAGIVACGVGIRIVIPRIVACMSDIAANGSSPEREARLTQVARPAQMFVWSIWLLLILISWLAVAKPE
ncbi:MAG: hypothetical protein RMM98_10820 [Acidobacteriota bacterium]|nr:hypothetical protein [Blastocatellia bacterium]MDW8240099.1 hypothetical protein [Acidobacteriota bacterium]